MGRVAADDTCLLGCCGLKGCCSTARSDVENREWEGRAIVVPASEWRRSLHQTKQSHHSKSAISSILRWLEGIGGSCDGLDGLEEVA